MVLLIILLSILTVFSFVVTFLTGKLAIIEESWILWIFAFFQLVFAFLILSGLITCLIK